MIPRCLSVSPFYRYYTPTPAGPCLSPYIPTTSIQHACTERESGSCGRAWPWRRRSTHTILRLVHAARLMALRHSLPATLVSSSLLVPCHGLQVTFRAVDLTLSTGTCTICMYLRYSRHEKTQSPKAVMQVPCPAITLPSLSLLRFPAAVVVQGDLRS